MKKKPILLLSSLAMTWILAVLLASLAAPAHAALAEPLLERITPVPTQMSDTTLSIAFSKTSVKPGEDFDLSVNIKTDAQTRGAQFSMTFDPKLVEISSDYDEGGFYKDYASSHNGSTIVLPQPNVDNNQGKISLTAVAIVGIKEGTGGPTGQGVLITFHGKAKEGASGNAPFSLGEIIVADAGAPESGVTAALGGVKSQDAALVISGQAAAAAPTSVPKQATVPGAKAGPTVTPEPTIAKLNALPSDDQSGGGSLPWEIILPVVGVVALGSGAFFFIRKRQPLPNR